MHRILIIKLTSLGDLVHLLPAITDVRQAHPHLEIDWLIDENFSEIATFHPAIKRIFTTNHRKWRGAWNQWETHLSIFRLIRKIRETKYDLIIDAQGNFKSALFTLFAKGKKAGCDRKSAAEQIAPFAYHQRYEIPKGEHAIKRLRLLFSKALSYPFPETPPNYSIDTTRFSPPPIPLPSEYITLIHNASWTTKLWPEAHWIDLIKQLVEEGHKVVLPWGNAEEEARAKRLQISSEVIVLPKLSLKEIGYVLQHSRRVIAVDTGLSHLSAALGVPSITLYGATSSSLIGASGDNQTHLLANMPCSPCNKKTCKFKTAIPPCLQSISPIEVLRKKKEDEFSSAASPTVTKS